MILKNLDGIQFTELVKNGALNLRANCEEVDNLNVFPVPDGDTGTNMCRTIEGGVRAILEKNEENIGLLGKDLARGMLLGARGNSGVILSQIFRGICKGLDGKSQVNAKTLAEAYRMGVKQAYGAVITPVEGTILTVFREATEYAAKEITEKSTINEFYQLHLKQAIKSLAKTKELLPVLKEANVIDSGGAGYVYIVKGIVKYLDGEKVMGELDVNTKSSSASEVDYSAFGPDDVLEFGYCTEFILQLQNSKVDIDSFDVSSVVTILDGDDIKGDSVVALKDGSVIKVHVHTMNPGLVLEKMRAFGEFLSIKIENMSLQHNEINVEKEVAKENMPHKKYAIVAVARGAGVVKQFKEFGVDYVVDGAQTMNPSTEDFIRAFKSLNADNILVFPNNKNIIMAAKQAAALYEDAKVCVINCCSIPQCYSALTMLDFSSDDLTIILGNFNEAIRNVTTGEVTQAIRRTKLHNTYINKGDYIGIINGRIAVSVLKKYRAITELLKKVKDIKDKQVITIIYGKNVTEDEKQKTIKAIQTKFPYLEIGALDGGQDIYDYLIAIE